MQDGIAASFLTKSQGLIYLSIPHCITNPNCITNPTGTRSLSMLAERGCDALSLARRLSPAIAHDLGSLNKQKHKTRIKHEGPSRMTLPTPGPGALQSRRRGNGQFPSDRSRPGGSRCLQTPYRRDHLCSGAQVSVI